MTPKTFRSLFTLSGLSMAFVLSIGVAANIRNVSAILALNNANDHYCADINFGTARYGSNSTVRTTSFTTDTVVVSSVAATAAYASSTAGTNTARIGTSSSSGTIKFTFETPVVITAIGVYACAFTPNKTSDFKIVTSGHGDEIWKQSIAAQSSFPTTFDLDNNYYSSGDFFSSDTEASTSLTIATSGTSANQLSLAKIVLKIAGVKPTSSNSTSSNPVSSSSSSVALSSISASGMSKTTYNDFDTLDTTGLKVTANYSDGTSKQVTGYTTNPANGAELSPDNTSVAISYTEGGVSKTTSLPITVNPGKSLMVRVQEILSAQYCDSIILKYGDWDCLIDGGTASDASAVSEALSTYVTDHKLDLYIGTHAHDDHIGMFKSNTVSSNVFSNAGITSFGYVIDCASNNTSPLGWKAYTNVVRPWMIENGATYIPAHAAYNSDSGYESVYGKTVINITGEGNNPSTLSSTIDSDVYLKILNTNEYLSPDNTEDSDPNATSVSVCFAYYNQRYIMCGDGEGTTQNGIIANHSGSDGKPNLWSDSSDVYLKAMHHGSNTYDSNSQTWIDWVNPDHVFVSAAISATSTVNNSTSEGVVKSQHPNPNAIQRFEKATYDIHWNGVNGTFKYNSSRRGLVTSFEGSAKQVPYYYNGEPVTGEETTTFPMSKWCTYSIYSACARTKATGHDSYSPTQSIGGFTNFSFDYDALPKAPSVELINEKGELYDEITHSYC